MGNGSVCITGVCRVPRGEMMSGLGKGLVSGKNDRLLCYAMLCYAMRTANQKQSPRR